MSSIDMHRNTIARKRGELSKLHGDKAKETKTVADMNKKILSAQQSMSRTRSQSTIKSKLTEIERSQKKIVQAETKISRIEKKIAKLEKDIASEEKKLRTDEDRAFKKREADAKRIQKSVETTLKTHDRLHKDTQEAIRRLENLPEKIKVLFLASNPIDQDQLRLDKENRKISQMIRMSEHRDSVDLVSALAAQPLDVLQAINEHDPAIVHFSGHGSANDEIVFQDNQGFTKPVSKDALVQTMVASSDNIRFVFLNACYSKSTALAVVEHVEAAIGMNDSIGDEAATVFSAQFYSAIGFGKNIKVAFLQAKAALMLEGIPEENTPALFVKDGLDPENIIIVKPPSDEEANEAAIQP
jgi:hypothetical protein